MSTVIIGGGGEAKQAIDTMVAKSIHATPEQRAAMEHWLAEIVSVANGWEKLINLKPTP